MSGNVGIYVTLPDGRSGIVKSQNGSACRVYIEETSEIITINVKKLNSNSRWFTKHLLKKVAKLKEYQNGRTIQTKRLPAGCISNNEQGSQQGDEDSE